MNKYCSIFVASDVMLDILMVKVEARALPEITKMEQKSREREGLCRHTMGCEIVGHAVQLGDFLLS